MEKIIALAQATGQPGHVLSVQTFFSANDQTSASLSRSPAILGSPGTIPGDPFLPELLQGAGSLAPFVNSFAVGRSTSANVRVSRGILISVIVRRKGKETLA